MRYTTQYILVCTRKEVNVAISDRIKAEARRTIDGIERFYDKYGIDVDDAEEREHRIARIEAAMEGCNGLTHDEKVQKTAENLFELTCAQERTYDMTRKEIKQLREENNKEFDILRGELRDGLKNVIRKIEESGFDGQKQIENQSGKFTHAHFLKFISEHPLVALNAFIFALLLVFISGHFSDILQLFAGK